MSSIVADWPAPPGIKALTTTRSGGVSRGRYAGNNLSSHTGDVPEAVAANRRALLADLDGCRRLQWLTQVHGSHCIHATSASAAAVPEADAAWTEAAGLGLVIQTADCVPVVLASSDGERVAALHGGWRGLAGEVIERTVEAIATNDVSAWIGPAIGVAAYEVGRDVFDAVRAHGVEADAVFQPGAAAGKWQLDLHALATLKLRRAGVAQVFGEPMCTHADERFYSYRRDGVTGRMATVIWRT